VKRRDWGLQQGGVQLGCGIRGVRRAVARGAVSSVEAHRGQGVLIEERDEGHTGQGIDARHELWRTVCEEAGNIVPGVEPGAAVACGLFGFVIAPLDYTM